MDFTCDGCGKYHWIPPQERTKQEAIDNLTELLEGFRTEPWQVTWLEHHEPELMRRFYESVGNLLKGNK